LQERRGLQFWLEHLSATGPLSMLSLNFLPKLMIFCLFMLTTVHLTTGILTLMLETLSLSSCVTCIRFLKLAHVFIVASESFLLVCSVQVKFAASCRGYL
jgi:hypothetical protein